jgi:acetylornithine deacetylase/succinyl-diaminopimelate desuccinylase-like protein
LPRPATSRATSPRTASQPRRSSPCPGAAGVAWLIQRRWQALGPPALVWNEGGASAPLEALGGVVANGIAVTEKRALWLTRVAGGEGGHGSQPVRDAANDRLVRALARVSAWETPLRLTPTVTEQFSRLGVRLGFPWNLALLGLRLPGSVTLPVQATGGNDSEPIRQRGIPAYGFLPALLTAELNDSIHGADERFPLVELERAVRVTTRVLERLVAE